ncbi:hypothetical protein [Streptomyces sp. WAC00263]|uniref:hypothetical protein n=1 Tax=Streptomyces sp. WAC00263 TaxID=1917422 RepID=UPI0015EF222D|nr:hypothetical protein [Streptomyces sp. WAC00263]KAF5990794.1 hypothetical protein BOG92_001270 [Streptomyces sp. WAC00263]
MKPELLGSYATGAVSRRFLLMGYLPSLAAGFFLLVLVWAGAPGSRISFADAWHTTSRLSAGELVVMVLGTMLVTLLVHPLQLTLVRLLEGAWPTFMAPVRRRCVARQRAKRRVLDTRSALPPDNPTRAQVQAAGEAGLQMRRRFPPRDRVMPSALGNALAAMEHRAGSAYGWDATVAWPRLYPLVSEQTRAIVDDRRDTMDTAVRLACTAFVAAAAALALLWRSGGWILLPLLLLAVSRIAYRGAVGAAVAYGEAVEAAFDLHRFDLVAALRLPLPADHAEERDQAKDVSAFWRQRTPVPFTYRHTDPPDGGAQ